MTGGSKVRTSRRQPSPGQPQPARCEGSLPRDWCLGAFAGVMKVEAVMGCEQHPVSQRGSLPAPPVQRAVMAGRELVPLLVVFVP